jgi:hypothetical protein
MAPYRCYLLDMDRIAAMQVVECENDADSVLEADKILALSPCTAAGIAIVRNQSSGKARQPKEPKKAGSQRR